MIKAVLTIDDIPSANTPAIVDYLVSKGIRAILFAVGNKLLQRPEEAVYALRRGMIVGNHSFSHPHFSLLSPEEAIEEIGKCEKLLDELYRDAGVRREYRPFRFPYGDKGGENKAALQRFLGEQGFSKVKDTHLSFPWWKEQGLDREIDTLWTYDFAEYRIRPGSGFTKEDVWKRMQDPAPVKGAPLFKEGSSHLLLLHAHDETEALFPDYYRQIIDYVTEHGVVFEEPAFL